MPRLILPDRDCSQCVPPGNRLMQHVRTETERVRRSGRTERVEYIAFFRCLRCGIVQTEVFDPQNPPRE